MRISVIKSANEVAIGSWQITNEKLAKFLITLNDAKNNLKKRRYTHWVKVDFNGVGNIELGNEPMCMGDYDEYSISPDTKVIIPIEAMEENHKQYICSTLNEPTLLQNKTLTENEEIIIVYTSLMSDEEENKSVINEMLLHGMKKCLFEYQMKAYEDYQEESMNKELFDRRVQQILNIMPDLEKLINRESSLAMQQEKMELVDFEYNAESSIVDQSMEAEDVMLDVARESEIKNSKIRIDEFENAEDANAETENIVTENIEIEHGTIIDDISGIELDSACKIEKSDNKEVDKKDKEEKEDEENGQCLRKVEINSEDDSMEDTMPVRHQPLNKNNSFTEDEDITEVLGKIVPNTQSEDQDSVKWVKINF